MLISGIKKGCEHMSKRRELATVWSIGSLGYGLLEIIWRGYTHWSMLLTGGVCFLSIYRLNAKIKSRAVPLKAFLSACVITVLEFFSGCLFNKLLKLNVWDYSRHKGNLLGQICPLYCMLWFFLCFPLVLLCKFIQSKCSITNCDKSKQKS